MTIEIGLLILTPILFGYYQDYKNNPKEFNIELNTFKKVAFKILIIAMLYFGINKIYPLLIPLNKNHGIEFNNQRKKIGLPKLEENWFINKMNRINL
jgi:hypothetical protein